VYDEATAHLEHARNGCRPELAGLRTLAVCREFRRWSISHPAEFTLVFASPLPALKTRKAAGSPHTPGAALRFAGVFGQLFVELWRTAPFPVPAAEAVPPALRTELVSYARVLGEDLPPGAVQIFASSWIRLYGLVSMEVFGHLHFADAAPMFEAELADIGRRLGIAFAP